MKMITKTKGTASWKFLSMSLLVLVTLLSLVAGVEHATREEPTTVKATVGRPLLRFGDNDQQDLEVRQALRGKIAAMGRQQLSGVEDFGGEGEGNFPGRQHPRQVVPRQRRLEQGDFDEFNKLFENAKILLPETYYETTALKVWITNMRCQSLAVGDIALETRRESNTKYIFGLALREMSLTCYADYRMEAGLLGLIKDNGSMDLYTAGNKGDVHLAFASPDFDRFPPESSTVEHCGADFSIYNMDFRGQFVSKLADAFEQWLRTTVEIQIESVACEELSSLGGEFVNDALGRAKGWIEKYQQPVPDHLADPLAPEKDMLNSEGKRLVNYQEGGDSMTGWLFLSLQKAVDDLAKVIEDPGGPTGTGTDLGINVALRRLLLDGNGALHISLEDLPGFDPVLFRGHDVLTKTVITLERISLYGLDSFQNFSPLVALGRHTLQNQFKWDHLKVELTADVSITTSELSDAVIADPDPAHVQEKVKGTFGVDNLDVVFSLLAAIDEELLGDLQLGSLLNSTNILPCLATIFHQVEISGLHVTVESVDDPVVTGFISPGLDRIFNQGVNFILDMYEKSLLSAFPGIFQGPVRDILQSEIIGSSLFDKTANGCPAPTGESGDDNNGNRFVDFRDLFLKPELASQRGGSGTEPYGDVGHMIFELVSSELLAPANATTSLAKINDVLIAPFTETQSGEKGALHMKNSSLMDTSLNKFHRLGWDTIRMRASDARVENLNTFETPMLLLQPNDTSGVLVDNRASMGAAPFPLRTGLSFLLALEGDPMLSGRNQIDIMVELTKPDLFAVLLAKLGVKELITFPVKHITNIDCWLSTLATPELNNGEESGLGIDSLTLALSSLRFRAECTTPESCTSAGLRELPYVLELLDEAGIGTVLVDKFISLAVGLLNSDLSQAFIDQWLVSASMRCPEHPNFDSKQQEEVQSFSVPPLLTMPVESLETIAFMATYAMEVASVVVAESHAAHPVLSDPLSLQKAQLEGLTTTRFIDFSDLSGSVGDWADSMVEMAKGTVRKPTEEPGGPNGETDLGVNVLLRSFLLDEERKLSLSFNDMTVPLPGGMELSLHRVEVTGLDTFTKCDILDAIGPQTLQNRFGWRSIGLQLEMEIRSDGPPSSSRRHLADGGVMTLSVSLEITDIEAALSLFLAIDQNKLGDLVLGQIVDVGSLINCFLSTVGDVSFTEMDISVGKIQSFVVSGFPSAVTAAAVESMTSLILGQYGELMASSVRPIFDRTVKTMLNNFLRSFVQEDPNFVCPKVSYDLATSPGYVDFRDLLLSESEAALRGGSGSSPYGNLFRNLMDLVNALFLEVDPETGLAAINEAMIQSLTEDQSNRAGRLEFAGDLFNKGARVEVGGLAADVKLRVRDAYIDNLDTFGAPLKLLDPVNGEPQQLNNSASIGIGRPLRFGFRFMIQLAGDDSSIMNDMDVSLDLNSLSIVLTALLKVAESRFLGFPLRDLPNYSCLLAMIPAPPLDARGVRIATAEPTISLLELALTVAQLKLNVSCHDCSGPRMVEFTELLSTTEASEGSTKVANDILNYVTQLLGGEFLQVSIDRMLNDAAKKCPHSPDFDPKFVAFDYEAFEEPKAASSMMFFVAVLIVSGCLIIVVSAFLLGTKLIVRRRHRKWLESLSGPRLFILWQQQGKVQEREAHVNETTRSMFTSPVIPRWIRWSMPVIILGNIGFFLSGHLSLGATVNVQATLAGESFKAENFFEFSMARSTVDIWKAGGKELAMMILLFSGVWPYTKQLITLVLWFVPPKMVRASKRLSIFLWLDALAKWSMVDIFVLVVTVAGFRVSVQSPDIAFLPEGFYSLDLLVIPMWGLYANMIAQLISQISSHFIIHYHRRIVEDATHEYDRIHSIPNIPQSETVLMEDGVEAELNTDQDNSTSSLDRPEEEKEKLVSHAFARPHRGESDKLVTRRFVSPFLAVIALSLTALVIVGCTLPSFSIDVLGIVGILVESGQEFREATKQYSLFTMIGMLFEQASFTDRTADYIGLGSLSILLILSVLVVPIVQAGVLVYNWFVPIGKRKRYRLSIVIEILQAWQYAEVYLIAVIVASWQLGPVSEYMINEYCGSLKETFAQLVYYGIMAADDAQCFRVNARVEEGAFYLVAAAILLALLNTFVMKAARQYFLDKDNDERRSPFDHKLEESVRDAAAQMDPADIKSRIEPVPVLFTDTFRWLLYRQDAMLSCSITVPSGNCNIPTIAGLPGGDAEQLTDDDRHPGCTKSDASRSASLNDDGSFQNSCQAKS